ncbi:alpha/beta hydrolase [Roseinatronobacter sp.]|uniref:alpha/beta hydrolase n=1 Tax=Roseinatronobacter sp. TaxID=1945755 RepID=UPI0025F2EAA3|nr:alpha/beta hydrolase [Roseibaca sp.]
MSAPFHADVADAPAPARVDWLTASDGVRLRAAFWGSGALPLVGIFPGRTEMVEKYGPTVANLIEHGFDVAVIDWRGQGLSDRLYDTPLRGDVPDFADYQKDVQTFWAWLGSLTAQPRHILAHSMGGCIALRALANGLPAQSVAFSAPMWGLALPAATMASVAPLNAVLRLTGQDTREVPGAGEEFELWNFAFERNELTRDPERYAWAQAQVRARPELRLGAPSMRWLAAALREMAALDALPSPALPAICGFGTGDKIISPKAIRSRMARWRNANLTEYDGALHELLLERPEVRDDFLTRCHVLFAKAD